MIEFKGSPNFDKNRKAIDRIVIHWFGVGSLQSANNRFQKPNNSSAHYGISDSTVWQWVKENHVAYHAGKYAMNQRSIGIEHDAGIRPAHDLSEESYQTSGKLVAKIARRYKIPLSRKYIIGHREVRATRCPGTVNIDKIIRIAKKVSINSSKMIEIQEVMSKDGKTLYLALGLPTWVAYKGLKVFLKAVGIVVKPRIPSKDL